MTPRTLTIPARLPGLNEIIDAAAVNRFVYRKMKNKWGQTVMLLARAQGFPPITEPAHFEYEFGEPNRRRDPSNIAAGGIKIIEDALQDAELLPNDSWNWVLSFTAVWTKSETPFVKVTVR